MIDGALPERGRYALTFAGYGNSQATREDRIRLPLARLMEKKAEELRAPAAAELAKRRQRRSSYLKKHPEMARHDRPSASATEVPGAEAAAAPANGLPAEQQPMMGRMSSSFNQLVSPEAPEAPAPELLAGGVLSAEERKMLIAAEARRMGLAGGAERTLVAVERRQSVSANHSPKGLDAKRQSRASSFSGLPSAEPLPPGSGDDFGKALAKSHDLGALLAEEDARVRARSDSVEERKRWASNPLAGKKL